MANLKVKAGYLQGGPSRPVTSFAMVVSVEDPNGPVTGLTADKFQVAVYNSLSQAGQPPFVANLSDFGEATGPTAGLYTMGITGLPAAGDPQAVVIIDVQSGADKGRGVINPVW